MKFLITTVSALVLGTAALAEPVKVGIASEPYPPFAAPDAAGNWVGWEAHNETLSAARRQD